MIWGPIFFFFSFTNSAICASRNWSLLNTCRHISCQNLNRTWKNIIWMTSWKKEAILKPLSSVYDDELGMFDSLSGEVCWWHLQSCISQIKHNFNIEQFCSMLGIHLSQLQKSQDPISTFCLWRSEMWKMTIILWLRFSLLPLTSSHAAAIRFFVFCFLFFFKKLLRQRDGQNQKKRKTVVLSRGNARQMREKWTGWFLMIRIIRKVLEGKIIEKKKKLQRKNTECSWEVRLPG